jgi:GH15 family glucan-1,4-alpha-glucosidase
MKQMDLAVIGNCSVASIINPLGRHVWFCFPRLDSDPVFNALVNGDAPVAGYMDVELENMTGSRQKYLRNTAIVETVLTCADNSGIRIVDFAPRFKRDGRVFRPPLIMRRIEPMNGRCRIKIRVRPTFDYGAEKPEMTFGSYHLRYASDVGVVRLNTDLSISYISEEVSFLLDRPICLALGSDEKLPDRIDRVMRDYFDDTVGYWRDWLRDLAIPFTWQNAVIRAAITLKLCSYEDTGAIMAALTTSIPESAGSGRNWDYRFCWLRDAFFTVNSLNRLSATTTMENYITYLLDCVLLSDNADLTPLYPLVPSVSLDEHAAPALAGFRGMGPVRIGNAAYGQRQNDIYGSVIMAAAQMFWDRRLPRIANADLYHRIKRIGKLAAQSAVEPDAGIWEYRGRTSAHTFSAAMCWAAIHRLGHIANKVGEAEEGRKWLATADELRTKILDQAWNATGNHFAGSLGGSELDAVLLLMPEIGIVRYDDPRFTQTLAALEKRLLRDGLMMRYTHADDFGEPETAFVVCTFWYIDALAACGRRDDALELFERVLALRNHVGLLSEDVAPSTGELWGNFPQTYSMVGLIHSALKLSRSWEEGPWRAS